MGFRVLGYQVAKKKKKKMLTQNSVEKHDSGASMDASKSPDDGDKPAKQARPGTFHQCMVRGLGFRV